MGTHLVFGLGSGRCGTQSLTKLLKSQRWRAEVSHESWRPRPTWVYDGPAILARIEQLQQLAATGADCVGEVAFYLLPYVRTLAAAFPTARFICLKRLKHLTVESFVRCEPGRDLWSTAHSKHADNQWYHQMPKYPVEGLRNALGAYWEDYYAQAAVLENELAGRFKVFRTWDLNELEGVDSILDFAGIPLLNRVVALGIHLHRSNP